jgi:hypothetical protein
LRLLQKEAEICFESGQKVAWSSNKKFNERKSILLSFLAAHATFIYSHHHQSRVGGNFKNFISNSFAIHIFCSLHIRYIRFIVRVLLPFHPRRRLPFSYWTLNNFTQPVECTELCTARGRSDFLNQMKTCRCTHTHSSDQTFRSVFCAVSRKLHFKEEKTRRFI